MKVKKGESAFETKQLSRYVIQNIQLGEKAKGDFSLFSQNKNLKQ